MVSGHPYYEQYVVKNYSPDQEGKYIKDEDVKRPHNHRWTKSCSDEAHSWNLWSTACAPTYRTCVECMRAGPLGQVCNECNRHHTAGYMILVSEDHQKILDSITVAEMFGKGIEVAKADMKNLPNMQRMKHFTYGYMASRVQARYRNIENSFEMERIIRKFWAEYQTMINEDED
jgi:hypothetical protein